MRRSIPKQTGALKQSTAQPISNLYVKLIDYSSKLVDGMIQKDNGFGMLDGAQSASSNSPMSQAVLVLYSITAM